MTRLVTWLARATAVLGGLVLCALIVLTTLSIIGRSLNKLFHTDIAQSAFGGLSNWAINAGVGEINGSYELLEAGVAFAIFAFFPVCQLYTGHATVDVFTSALPPRALAALRAFWEIVLAATIVFLTFRLADGMMRREHPHVADAADHVGRHPAAPQKAHEIGRHDNRHLKRGEPFDVAANAQQRALHPVADHQKPHTEQQGPGTG